MKKKSYHHGHLRNAMIESGIRLLTKEGMSGFSLRKVAASCHVSSSAPYSHFENKEALLTSMESHINAKLLWRLYPVLRLSNEKNSKEFIFSLSTTYITFFWDNPHYFMFLFRDSPVALSLSLPQALTQPHSPFFFLYRSCCRILKENQCPEELWENRILSFLSTVHGLLFFMSTPGFCHDQNWITQLSFLLAPAVEGLFKSPNPHPQNP